MSCFYPFFFFIQDMYHKDLTSPHLEREREKRKKKQWKVRKISDGKHLREREKERKNGDGKC